MKYKNPIISGFNPDPSICRVNEDYYIVTSTFEYYPGVPIYHSNNLINWELISYCLTDHTQLPLNKCRPSGGIYAPTLRYYDGYFFMTTTNVSHGGNFIVHTKNIIEGWSKPMWVNQGGIDPSLLFDDDGKVYFTSTGLDESGRQGIYICEINPYTGDKITDSVCISYGCGGRYPEAPHLYKWFNKYYLMIAEGGTEYGHMETIQRADNPYGPFEVCPYNPILSHRDDMRGDISCTGHADMMEDHNGNWWLVCLGVRTCSNNEHKVMLHNIGRETYLAPVLWTKDGWPLVGDNGIISLEMDGELPGIPKIVNRNFCDDFSRKSLRLDYNFLRNPIMDNYILNQKERQLILKGTEVTLNDIDSPTWIGIRQKGFETITTVKMKILSDKQDMRAGITSYYNNSYHYEIYLTKQQDKYKVCLAKHVHDIFAITGSINVSFNKYIFFKVVSDKENYIFYFSYDGINYIEIGKALTAGLCTEGTLSMTFTGTYLAMFAENGTVAFEDFRVEVLDY